MSWAHQNGALQSNGSITIKSQSGGAYAGQVNPVGAVAKSNQSAVTQPPTIIIQATSGGLPFSYKDDCYIFYPPSGFGYANETAPRIGIGKFDSAQRFTGTAAYAEEGSNNAGAAVIFSALTGASLIGPYGSASSGTQFIWAANPHRFWAFTGQSATSVVVGAASLPTEGKFKCYP